MNFKDQLDKDLENVFFNLDEFAEIVNLNGVEVKGIFQSVKYEPFSVNKNDSAILGISNSYIKLYYKEVDAAEVFKAQDEPSLVSAGAFTATKRLNKKSRTDFLL